jgi:hypothetical protein
MMTSGSIVEPLRRFDRAKIKSHNGFHPPKAAGIVSLKADLIKGGHE